jgi:hypothetical protein
MNANRISQLELGLGAKLQRRTRPAGRQRRQRAKWWFEQMRRVVGAAMEWRPEAQGRQEQGCFELAGKRP